MPAPVGGGRRRGQAAVREHLVQMRSDGRPAMVRRQSARYLRDVEDRGAIGSYRLLFLLGASIAVAGSVLVRKVRGARCRRPSRRTTMLPYEDPARPVDERVADLLARMT